MNILKKILKLIIPKPIMNILKKMLRLIIPKPNKKRRISFIKKYYVNEILPLLRRWKLVPNEEYKQLRKFHNIHKGERCFVIGTGSSLTISDLNKLKSETTFSVNQIFRSFNDTAWRPTYYVTQHPFEWVFDMNASTMTGIRHAFISHRFEQYMKEHMITHDAIFPCGSSIYPLNVITSIKLSRDKSKYVRSSYKRKFSGDISAIVYGVNNIITSTLQIAVYMGFSEIYLLGCDCNIEYGKSNHFYKNSYLPQPKNPLDLTKMSAKAENLILTYKVAKEYADKHGIKIYNATRGGALEVYERVDLDEVLASKSSASEE